MSTLQYAGEFELVKAKLLTTKGIEHDLSLITLAVELYEDIFSSAITGTILLTDTSDIINSAPIVGHETLLLTLRTPYETASDKTTIKLEVAIFKINAATQMTHTADVISLSFISHEAVRNGQIRVSKSYKGEPSVFVEDIIRNKLNSKKKLEVEVSDNNFTYIAPNKRPFDAISAISKRCVGIGPSYLFYETTKGYMFKSIEKMFNKAPETVYTNDIVDEGADVFKALHTITEMDTISSFDTLINQRKGLYSSNLTTINTYNKSFTNNEYDYLDQIDSIKLNEYPLVSETVNNEGKTVTEYPSAVIHVESVDDVDDSDASYTINSRTPYNTQGGSNWLQRRQSKIAQIQSGIKLSLTIPGQTSIESGDVIALDLVGNDSINGKYIVVSLKHTFQIQSRKHECLLEVVKDSVKTEISSSLVPYSNSGTSKTILF